MTIDKNRLIFWATLGFVVLFALLSIYFLKPEIEGDTPSYLDAISVLNGAQTPPNFSPNRILTTFGALESVILFTNIFGSIFEVWLFLNLIFYFIVSFAFYFLVRKIFNSTQVAFLATLFLASNYALLDFGLTYLMDIGGWAFYTLSLLFTYRYIESGNYKNLLWAGMAIGIGGLFKEYAFLACIPIAVIVVYEYWQRPLVLIKKAILPALFTLLPIVLVYAYVFKNFDYSYLDWLSFNKSYYVYDSRIIEYIKSLGSLYNFLAFLLFGGLYCALRFGKEIMADKKTRIFIMGVFLSILPILFWPAITQRILFITVPAGILLASFLFKKYEKYWWDFLPILALYAISNLAMDTFILPNLNLPF